MKSQNYETHTRVDPFYHYVLSGLLLAAFILSIIQVVRSLQLGEDILQAFLIVLIVVSLIIIAILVRIYPLRSQDRAIRAEENLRHYVLTGKLLDKELRLGQIIALRFADDKEFPSLCERAVKENMIPKEIKKAIIHWKADHNRV